MNSKEKEMRRLIQKLETQNDISFEEVKWIHALMGSLIETISKMPLPTSMSDAEELELQNSLSKDYPILALKDWHDAVARKIKAGYSGNFIFTLRLSYGISAFDHYWRPATKALDKYGRFEDRVVSIGVNRIVYSSLPEYVQPLFDFEIYGLRFMESGSAGMFRYPRKIPGADKTYTLSQVFKKMSLIPVISADSEVHIITNINSTYDYIIEYLQQRIPYVEMDLETIFNHESFVFTDKESVPIFKAAMTTTFEELIDNASYGVVNKETIERLTAHKGYIIDDLSAEKFTKASLKYIDRKVQRMLGREEMLR